MHVAYIFYLSLFTTKVEKERNNKQTQKENLTKLN